jgi:hypothetical protein
MISRRSFRCWRSARSIGLVSCLAFSSYSRCKLLRRSVATRGINVDQNRRLINSAHFVRRCLASEAPGVFFVQRIGLRHAAAGARDPTGTVYGTSWGSLQTNGLPRLHVPLFRLSDSPKLPSLCNRPRNVCCIEQHCFHRSHNV